MKNPVKQKVITISQKFFQLVKQKEYGYRIK